MAAKWIVINNEFRFGNVGLHEDLIVSDIRKDVKGGGLFRFSPENKTLLLFGESFDFGSCQVEDLYKVKKWPAKLEDFKISFLDYANQEHTLNISD